MTKNHQKPYFWGSRSFKVINVDIPKKLVTSACYDKQHVCAYLQASSSYTSQQQINNHFLERYPSLCATAECFVHLSHRRGVRLFIRLSHCGIVSKWCKLESQNFHCKLPKDTKLFVTKFRAPGCGDSPRIGASKRGIPTKNVILPLLARIV